MDYIQFVQMNLPVLAFGVSIFSLAVSVTVFFFSRKTHIANRRPHLVFIEKVIDKECTEKGTEIGFYLYNIGLGPAFNIELKESSITACDLLKEFGQIPRNLTPNGETLFNRANVRLINNNVILKVRYEDHENRKYQANLKNLKHSFKRVRWYNKP